MDKISNTTVSELVSEIATAKDADSLAAIEKKLESAILVLHGDLKSIDRQIDQREITKSLDKKLGEGYDPDLHESWLFKIRRATQYKREQIRQLERALGDARDNNIDKKFIFIDKILDAAVFAANFLEDIEASLEAGTLTPETLKEMKSKSDLEKSIEVLDRSWEDWCE